MTFSGIVSLAAFLAFQFLPRQIISLFGEGSEEYFQFAVRYFRIFMMLVLIDFAQPISSNMFTSIGKPIKGVFLSLTRQILFLLPLYLILPRFFGIDGIIYSGPVADLLAFICTMVLVTKELKEIRGLMAKEAAG